MKALRWLLLTTKLNSCLYNLLLSFCFKSNIFKNIYFGKLIWRSTRDSILSSPVGIYMLKVNNRNTRTRCKICSKLTIKTLMSSVKKMWSKFPKFHRKTTVLKSFSTKVAGLQACNFTKRRLQYKFLHLKFTIFLRTPVLKNNCF